MFNLYNVQDLKNDAQHHKDQTKDKEAEPPERGELPGGLLSERDPVIVPREYERDSCRPYRSTEPHHHADRTKEEARDSEDNNDHCNQDVLHIAAEVVELLQVRKYDCQPLAWGVQDAGVCDYDVEGYGYPPYDHQHRVVREGLEEVPLNGFPAVKVPKDSYAKVQNSRNYCAKNPCFECSLLLVHWP